MKRIFYIIICLVICRLIYVYGDSAAILIVALSISAASIMQLLETAFAKAEKRFLSDAKADYYYKKATFCGKAVVFFMYTVAITVIARFFLI